SFALPLTAASYPLAAIFARFYLHEEVNLSRGLGTLIITVGVAIVVLGEPGGLLNRPAPAQAAPSPGPVGPLETSSRRSASLDSIKSSKSPTRFTTASSSGASRT